MLHTHDEIIQFYREAFDEYGPTPRGAAWADAGEQHDRTMGALKLVQVLRNSIPSRVLEVGCGYGFLPAVWKELKQHFKYTGVDLYEDYIRYAQSRFYKDPDAVFVCEPFEDFPIDNLKYGLTLAIGTIAWQPKDTGIAMLRKLWDATTENGVMLFTYLPGNPFVPMEINILRTQFSVTRYIDFSGYAASGEHMVAFQKPVPQEWMELEDDEDLADVDLVLATEDES